MILVTRRRDDNREIAYATLSENEYVEIVTETGCFSIRECKKSIEVSVPVCDTLGIRHLGVTEIRLEQIRK